MTKKLYESKSAWSDSSHKLKGAERRLYFKMATSFLVAIGAIFSGIFLFLSLSFLLFYFPFFSSSFFYSFSFSLLFFFLLILAYQVNFDSKKATTYEPIYYAGNIVLALEGIITVMATNTKEIQLIISKIYLCLIGLCHRNESPIMVRSFSTEGV